MAAGFFIFHFFEESACKWNQDKEIFEASKTIPPKKINPSKK